MMKFSIISIFFMMGFAQRCGAAANNNPCGPELCCSSGNYCGLSINFCGSGCQIAFGLCGNVHGICNPINGNNDCPNSQCCSSNGFCGSGDAYCNQDKVNQNYPLLTSKSHEIHLAVQFNSNPNMIYKCNQYNLNCSFLISPSVYANSLNQINPLLYLIHYYNYSIGLQYYNEFDFKSADQIASIINQDRSTIFNLTHQYPTYIMANYNNESMRLTASALNLNVMTPNLIVSDMTDLEYYYHNITQASLGLNGIMMTGSDLLHRMSGRLNRFLDYRGYQWMDIAMGSYKNITILPGTATTTCLTTNTSGTFYKPCTQGCCSVHGYCGTTNTHCYSNLHCLQKDSFLTKRDATSNTLPGNQLVNGGSVNCKSGSGKYQSQNPQPDLYSTCLNPKHIALTIEDGPNTANDPTLLTQLSNNGIKATFFVSSAAVTNDPELIDQLLVRDMKLD
eukprot:NODE_322_length_9794_cov_0.486643.p3 type:complete len:449 gc:universal NODE_322_length_9794_cov_0.486643:1953-607(-)